MAYRDELEALRSREEALVRELEETRRLRVASERRTLPVLEQLRVASPCPSKWEDMIGDERVRFCGSCAKNVYDLSAMSRAEAEDFVARHSPSERAGKEGVCVTFRRRADGKVLTADCPVGVRRRRFGIGVIAFAAAASAAAFGVVVEDRDSGVARPSLERHCPAHKTADHRTERSDESPSIGDDGNTVTTGLIMGDPPKPSGRTTGCLCQPGDPLCSCL